MQKARRHILQMLRPLVGRRFQGLFHSSVRGSFHLSFTVLVRYRSLGSIQPYGMGPAVSHRISRVPRYSGYYQASSVSRVRDCHPISSFFPKRSTLLISCHIVVLQPLYCLNSIGLGCSPFARHYLGNHFCFLLLWVLRCFSSPRLPSLRNDRPSTCRVAPFGNHGINCYLHIPRAYRSLSRPSSPPRAKASAIRSCLLLYFFQLLVTLVFLSKIQ